MYKDLKYLIGGSSVAILTLVGFMFFSPLSSQLTDDSVSRGSSWEMNIEELISMGFENVRCTENDNERIYTIENNVFKAQGFGIAKAIEIIQRQGLPMGKQCKVIFFLYYNIRRGRIQVRPLFYCVKCNCRLI